MECNSEGSDVCNDYDSDKDAEYKPPQKKSQNALGKFFYSSIKIFYSNNF